MTGLTSPPRPQPSRLLSSTRRGSISGGALEAAEAVRAVVRSRSPQQDPGICDETPLRFDRSRSLGRGGTEGLGGSGWSPARSLESPSRPERLQSPARPPEPTLSPPEERGLSSPRCRSQLQAPGLRPPGAGSPYERLAGDLDANVVRSDFPENTWRLRELSSGMFERPTTRHRMFGSLPDAEDVEPAIGRSAGGAPTSSTVAGAVSSDVAMPGGGGFTTGGFVQRNGAWWSAMDNDPGVLDRPSSIKEVSDSFKQWEAARHKDQVDCFAEQLPTPEINAFADIKTAVAGLEDWGRKDFEEWVSHIHREARSPMLETNRDRTFQGLDLHLNPMLDPAHKPEEREEHESHLQVRNAASDILANLEQINTEDGRERQQLATVRDACGALHEGLAAKEARRVAKPLPRNARLLEWAACEARGRRHDLQNRSPFLTHQRRRDTRASGPQPRRPN